MTLKNGIIRINGNLTGNYVIPITMKKIENYEGLIIEIEGNLDGDLVRGVDIEFTKNATMKGFYDVGNNNNNNNTIFMRGRGKSTGEVYGIVINGENGEKIELISLKNVDFVVEMENFDGVFGGGVVFGEVVVVDSMQEVKIEVNFSLFFSHYFIYFLFYHSYDVPPLFFLFQFFIYFTIFIFYKGHRLPHYRQLRHCHHSPPHKSSYH